MNLRGVLAFLLLLTLVLAPLVYWRCRQGDSGPVGGETPGSVTGTVFSDRNDNGRLDSVDAGLTGWKVHLAGTLSDSTLTASGGVFQFTSLPLGAYTLWEEVPSPWIQTTSPTVFSFTLSTVNRSFSGNFGNYLPFGSGSMTFSAPSTGGDFPRTDHTNRATSLPVIPPAMALEDSSRTHSCLESPSKPWSPDTHTYCPTERWMSVSW